MLVSRPAQIPDLLNLIHDHWFDVERIQHDPAKRTVLIGFQKTRPRLGIQMRDDFLVTVGSVSKVTIEDEEKVQFYDLDQIRYSPNKGELTLTGGIPITITIMVGDLHLEVEQEPQE